MRLNFRQRTGVANLLGDMAVAIIFGLTLAILMGGIVAWWTTALMCIFSLLLTVASVYIRSPPRTKNGD
jgi:predicted MFS family arabinose efflux permease